jgi:hypothetical protein
MKDDPDIHEGSSTAPLMATTLQSYGAAERVTIDNDETTPLVVMGDAEDSSPRCQDSAFAIIFWIHAVIMIWLGLCKAPKGYEDIHFDFSSIEEEMRKGGDVTEEDIGKIEEFATQVAEFVEVYPTRILLYLLLPCCIIAFAIAFLITAFVVKNYPRTFVYSSLAGSMAMMVIIMVGSALASGSLFMAATTGLMIFAVGYYVSVAWRMVPFAAVNLKASLEGISRNCGVYLVAFVFAELGFVWLVFWLYTFVGVSMGGTEKCKAAHPDSNFDPISDDYDDICDPPFGVVLFFMLSLFWTSTVVMVSHSLQCSGLKYERPNS